MLAPPLLAVLALAAADLSTLAERTAYAQTGRYAEVEQLCGAFQKAFPFKARCERFGTTPEGRPLLALVASADGSITPEWTKLRKRPVVLVQAASTRGRLTARTPGCCSCGSSSPGRGHPPSCSNR